MAAPELSEVDRLRLLLLDRQLRIAQLEYEALVLSLRQPGYDLDPATLHYVPVADPVS
jgi:hypothetical protein